ncbi:hypothetical protein P691DRAFT_780082 [Macrolepiota fuliginosa MF-IS2]|uniref:Uncharacterized protein n=1 Tax=Macrolepiota fuliginosa MF-IS2 TaxID=1400762 RepID=A0A9P6BWD9_9AGAR|nr:hypothetical protein P691DRAFT_780082 [Macrolepiota fuliginosa MF-IS2]
MSNPNQQETGLSIAKLREQMEAEERLYEERQARRRAQMAEALRVEEEWRKAEEAWKAEEQRRLAAEAEEHRVAAEAAQREWAAEERRKKQRAEKAKKTRDQERAAERESGPSRRNVSGDVVGRKRPRVIDDSSSESNWEKTTEAQRMSEDEEADEEESCGRQGKGKGKATSWATSRGGKQKMGGPGCVCQRCSEMGKECLPYTGERARVFVCAACHKDGKGCKPIRVDSATGRAAELQEACHTNELLQELVKTMAGIEATQQEQLRVAQSTRRAMRGQMRLLTEVRVNLEAIWQQGRAGLEDLESEESDDEFKEGASGDSEDGEEEEEEEEAEEEMEVEKEKEKVSGEGGEMEVD